MPNSPWASAPRSTPVEKARPSPVMTTTRTAGRAPIVATTSLRSRAKLASPALSTSGRSRVRRATGPVTSRRIVLGLAMSQWFTIKGLVTPLIVLLCLLSLSNTFSLGAFPAILPELARGSGLADWQLGVVASAFGFARMTADIPIGLFLTDPLRRAAAPPGARPEAALRAPGGHRPGRPGRVDHADGGPRLRRRGRDRRRVLDRGAVRDPAPRQPRVRARARRGRAPPPGDAGLRHRRAAAAGCPRRPPRNRAGARGGAPRDGGSERPRRLRHATPRRRRVRALRPLHGRLDAAARRPPARDTARARRLADRALPRVRRRRVVPRPLPRRVARRGPRPGPRGRLGRVARRDQPALLRPRKETIMNYADYQHLTFERKPHGVLLTTINRPEVMNATHARLHWELTQVWLTVDADREVRVALATGAGKAFSAGGDRSLVEEMAGNPDAAARTMREASDLVYNMINLDKPVVSAINGAAVGAGLVVALLADVSIIAETARLTDGHTRLGVAAGDHAAIIWPLLCGMAKAKYYLLTADFLDGREAERIGLVSLCVPGTEVLPKALDVATRLAQGSQLSIRWTKRALNNWLRQAGPIFDQSLALEMLTFMHPDVREGARALREKRAPAFPSAR